MAHITTIRPDDCIWRTLIVVGLLCLGGCGKGPLPPPPNVPNVTAVASTDETLLWVESTEQLGLDFRHDSGPTGELLLPEIMGSGAGLVDVDNDGDLDVFFVQGGPIDTAAETRPPHRLYRNDLDANSGRGLHFTDTTESSGIQSVGYGMGVATGDYDNDGLVDLYVTNLGSNQLLKNLGGGRFADVTKQANVDDPQWSSSATFFDYDRDGHLDLFVANYVQFDKANSPKCYAPNSARDYCGPDAYPAAQDSLFHNLGNGRFENVTEAAGMLGETGAGLGVVAADVNQDGWCDLYVANDGDPNHLWINQQGTGHFIDDGLIAGVALNIQGQAEAGMGVDAADLDDDGDEDLFVTNLTGESNTLYINLGNGLFEDRTNLWGMRAPSLPFTSFGTRFLDYDHDGDLDLFAMNGAVRVQHTLVASGDPNPLRQTNQLFRNESGKTFLDVSAQSGQAFAFSGVSRGACIGDVDNDGDFDLLTTTNHGPARLLLNQASLHTHWLGLRLIDPRTGQDVFQTKLKITGGKHPVWRRVHSDGSYQCASDPRVVVGLSQDASPRSVTAWWPDGLAESWSDLAPDKYHVLKRGTGVRVETGSQRQ